MKRLSRLLLPFVLILPSLFGQTVTIAETLKDAQGSNLVGYLYITNPPFLYPNGATKTVTGATNATPIEITTSAAHGLSTGNTVYITGVTGATGANGTWAITITAATTFTLDGSTASGVYVSGGTVQQYIPVGAQKRRFPASGTFTGSISTTLIPTTTAVSTPGGQAAGYSYLVQYFLNDGSTISERWNVATTPTSQTISAVRIAATVTPTAVIGLSQLAQSTATGSRNYYLSWNGSAWAATLINNIINAQTGTSYTVLDTDRASLVTFSNTSSIAVTLPQANASTFTSGWYAWLRNINTGRVTITPTTSTIDGASTYVLDKDEDILVISDATNYSIARGNALKPRGDFGCTGTATSSTTLYIAAGGPTAACTDTTEGSDNKLLATRAGRIRNLRVFAGTGGFNASSGLVTVRINGANSAVVCTVGTGTTCSDTTNHAAIAAGDRITVSVTTQATETLADLAIAVEY